MFIIKCYYILSKPHKKKGIQLEIHERIDTLLANYCNNMAACFEVFAEYI